jgi:dienelactone hydrolase
LVRDVLGFSMISEQPQDVRVERRWKRDGLAGEEISWWVGYGPRTHAWLLRPGGQAGPLPGVVALHDHGAFKFFGKEKIADGPVAGGPVAGDLPEDAVQAVQAAWRATDYGGRAWTNALAHEGFAVLVHDTFLWGSRRFPLETMPEFERHAGQSIRAWHQPADRPVQIAEYNAAATFHEHLVEKYCSLLGTTFAGVVAYEDRVALNYLAGRSDVRADRLGCAGLSGGGCRSALLGATSERVAASVIVGMMSTFDGLLDHNVASHTWMFFPATWARYGDWTDLTASRAPAPLLVQYDLEDPLFTEAGMRAADARLAAHYAAAGQPGNYVGQFYPGPHKFDLPMQTAAFAWLKQHLAT